MVETVWGKCVVYIKQPPPPYLIDIACRYQETRIRVVKDYWAQYKKNLEGLQYQCA